MAIDWVERHGAKIDGFFGAYFIGSTVDKRPESEVEEGSDVDIMVVVDVKDPGIKLGKFTYCGVLLEVSYVSWDQISDPIKVVESYHLANGLRKDTVIADATGALRPLQRTVQQEFPKRGRVLVRSQKIRQAVVERLSNLDATATWPDQVTSWLFATGITTHMVLVAALKNPTVRLRYIAVREVLTQYGFSSWAEQLLGLIGASHLTQAQVSRHLLLLEHTFDATVRVSKSDFPFSTDITAPARSISIDGLRVQIQRGFHREVVFWIVATFARCHKILAADAPELGLQLLPDFGEVTRQIGIAPGDKIQQRARETIHVLPSVWDLTKHIININPGIERP
ncbi:MAG TPA: hypothetical protein VHW44_20305 [Pseudonocardiaceae bacterium]|nr:hypothetical protein [Pseudonocardiaceae bacterium]